MNDLAAKKAGVQAADILAVVGRHYRHWKGGLYRVSGVSRSAEDGVSLDVLYEPLYDLEKWDGVPWRRNADEFFGAEPRSKTGFRFTPETITLGEAIKLAKQMVDPYEFPIDVG